MALSVGAAKCKVDLTAAIGGPMQGFADTSQKASKIGMDFYSRAFTISANHVSVAIAVVDLWACTESIKKAAIARLHAISPGGRSLFTTETVQVLGTHTHSGPAGVSEYGIYNYVSGKTKAAKARDAKIRAAYVEAIARSIFEAHRDSGEGDIHLHRVEVEDCGRNRSVAAYLNNPKSELRRYRKDTDTEMVILEFRQKFLDKRIGILTWYPIHGTDLGQKNTVLHGDNKGVASRILEVEKEFCPVAAFANANAGDVSGNVEYGTLPTKDPARALKHGTQQANAVMKVLGDPTTRTRGRMPARVDCKYAVVDMSNVTIAGTSHRTFVPTLGLATFVGSTEDSTSPLSGVLSEGLERDHLSIEAEVVLALLASLGSENNGLDELRRYVAKKNPVLAPVLKLPDKLPGLGKAAVAAALTVLAPAIGIALGGGIALARQIVKGVQSAVGDMNARSVLSLTKEQEDGHAPKPIAMVAAGLVPSTLPLQLMRIGDVVIAGVPGEMTTMAGRRLREALAKQYDAARSRTREAVNPVATVVISGYANAYSQYITTPQEYAKQHYEGASTLFGPHTLDAYIQEFCRLVPAR